MDGVIVCYARCWPCQFGQHFSPPEWHTWADADDIDHARETGQPDPSKSRCGCRCAGSDPAPEPTLFETPGAPEVTDGR